MKFLNGLAAIKLKVGVDGLGGIGGLASESGVCGRFLTSSAVSPTISRLGGAISRLEGESSDADSIRQGNLGLFGRGRVLLLVKGYKLIILYQ